MSPEERREAIIAATIPLVLDNGVSVTTREIAEACGIAEGTIFRVFATKQELLVAAVQQSLLPDDAVEKLRFLDRGQPLDEHVRSLLKIIAKQFSRRRTLELALASPVVPDGRRFRNLDKDAITRLHEGVADALAGYASKLRVTPRVAAKILLAAAVSRATLRPNDAALSADEAVDFVMAAIAQAYPR
jgi:AcrR family transcriptional regulator